MKKFCAYIHIFPNGKKYIGITSKAPNKRWQNGTGYDKEKQPVIYNAIQKYGWENIEHQILFENLSFQEANEKEKELIALYKTNCRRYGNKYGYNMTDGGDGTLGHVAGENVSRVNRERMTGKKGKDCCNSRPVICDGVEYESLTDFRERNNLPRGNLTAWLGGKFGMPKYWYDKKLHYKDTDFSLVKCSEINIRKIVIDDTIFKTLEGAGAYLGVSAGALCYYLTGKKKLPKKFEKYSIRYEDEPFHIFETTNQLTKKKVEYDGRIFDSQRQLASYLDVKPATLNAWLMGKNSTPKEYLDKGLKRIE